MARNLRAKMSRSDTLIVHDINQSSMQKLVDEVKAAGFGADSVEMTDSARTVAEKSVRMTDSTYAHRAVCRAKHALPRKRSLPAFPSRCTSSKSFTIS